MMYTTDMVVCLNPRQDLTDGLQRQLLDCVSALVPAIQYARAITTVAQLTLLGIAYAGLCVCSRLFANMPLVTAFWGSLVLWWVNSSPTRRSI